MTASSRKIRRIFIIGCSVKLMHTKVFSLYAFLFLFSLLHCAARDTITTNTFLSDNGGETIVSPGERFELGFFTPNGSSIRRYVGIWYYKSSPRTVVWVANRDNPILDNTGALSVSNDGNLKVTDGSGKSYWSTNLEGTPQTYRIAKLMESGNLVLNDQERIIWQSFDNPTDTFLPGMKMDEDIVLLSWKSHDDPAPGNFSFQLNQGDNKYVIWKRSIRYWTSDASGKLTTSDEMSFAISYLLSNFSTSSVKNNSVPYLEPSLYTDTRMVLSFSGQIQCLKLDTDKIWSLIWAEPRDSCSLYNACGNFGLCNSRDNLVCKCLPGFNPSSPDYWSAGDFSGGCTRRSSLCGKNAMRETTYLSLKMMKLGDPDSKFVAKNEMECKLECLSNCQCQAFSYEETQTNKSSPGVSNCWIWSEDLNNLEEEYNSGRNINVRIAVSDIESTERNCKMCGANLIPYPLSTGLECGEPMYFNFHCNISTAQVNFETPSGIYRVKSINPETRKFVIQAENADACEAGKSNFQLNLSSPFRVISWCNSGSRNFSVSDVSLASIDEVEISWKPPPEPTCTSPLDCKDWPNSICSATKYGGRCICNTHFKWDGLSLNCSEESSSNQHVNEPLRGKMSFSIIIAVSFMSVISLIILMSVTAYICLKRIRLAEEQGSKGTIRRYSGLNLYGSERCVKDMIDSNQFSEDDTKGIDVPFFTLESILAATNNFALANRLGQGGFGTVYKAKFPGGEQIAVKRLSSASGQGSEEFKNEVLLIAKLQHRNLVRLLGYCVEGEEKMLLYEFMPNKSLDSFIFDRKLCTSLDWEMRYNIILGIARGLLYLHQDSRLRIIHRDLKTSNILLDEDMNPKISDFGLARIFGGSKETAVNTNRVVGTYGYMSPEYALDGLFSFKSDVFSFGVVVLETITGKRNTGFYEPVQSLSLLGYSWHLWKEDKALDLLDKTLNVSCNLNELYKCLNVGLLCLQEDPSDRPTMSSVVFMLGSETASLPTPKQPAFIARKCSSNKASSSSKRETFSNNELTVTLYDGR